MTRDEKIAEIMKALSIEDISRFDQLDALELDVLYILSGPVPIDESDNKEFNNDKG